MSTHYSTREEMSLAAIVAGEDLRRGDYVSALNESWEVPSCYWERCDSQLAPDEPVRIVLRAREGGLPLKVKAICLPFVYAVTPRKEVRMLDLRQVQLVRLGRDYARRTWKALSADAQKQSTPPLI